MRWANGSNQGTAAGGDETGALIVETSNSYAREVLPLLRDFKPDLLMISAGFDAHELDPLGQLRMTTGGFQRMTAALLDVADEICSGRAVLVTEGGYDLAAVAQCLTAIVESSVPS